MVAIKRVIALTLVLLSGCALFTHRQAVPDLTGVGFDPPVAYQLWAQSAIDCAVSLKVQTPDLPYTIVHDSVNVWRDLRWFLVPTEAADGSFPCWAGRCAGQTRNDTILVSSQYYLSAWVVKHEVMHWAVESASEYSLKHDLPWGFCEWIKTSP